MTPTRMGRAPADVQHGYHNDDGWTNLVTDHFHSLLCALFGDLVFLFSAPSSVTFGVHVSSLTLEGSISPPRASFRIGPSYGVPIVVTLHVFHVDVLFLVHRTRRIRIYGTGLRRYQEHCQFSMLLAPVCRFHHRVVKREEDFVERVAGRITDDISFDLGDIGLPFSLLRFVLQW